MEAVLTKVDRLSKTTFRSIDEPIDLYSLLEEGLSDIRNGNVLNEEEMDRAIDLV